MSYVKLPLVCEDHAVGYQSVNQLADNAAALRDAYGLAHGLLEPPPGLDSNPWSRAGRHNTIEVARTVARVRYSTAGVVTIDVQGSGIRSLAKSGTGQWQVELVSGIGDWRAALTPEGTSTTVRGHTVYDSGTALLVTTWELGGGTFAPTDFDFSLVVWGAGTA